MIWFMAKTLNNKFIDLPYLGWQYQYDSLGKKVDSTVYSIPDFELTSFDGTPITRDSIRDKFIILTTIQNDCPDLNNCGMGMVLFNEIIYGNMLDHPKNYHNVRVLSILTDKNGKPDSIPSPLLKEEMAAYDLKYWWLATGDVSAFYSFPYYGDLFINYPATPAANEIGTTAFVNSMVLIDKRGCIRGVTGAKSDTALRNFFDLLKLLKKEEFKADREAQKH